MLILKEGSLKRLGQSLAARCIGAEPAMHFESNRDAAVMKQYARIIASDVKKSSLTRPKPRDQTMARRKGHRENITGAAKA